MVVVGSMLGLDLLGIGGMVRVESMIEKSHWMMHKRLKHLACIISVFGCTLVAIGGVWFLAFSCEFSRGLIMRSYYISDVVYSVKTREKDKSRETKTRRKQLR